MRASTKQLLAAAFGICVWGFTTASDAQERDTKTVLEHWTAGLDGVSAEELSILRPLAQESAKSQGLRALGFPKPGSSSEIVRLPVFFDLIEAVGPDNPELDDNIRNLVKQAGERFFYFESGVSIVRDRDEEIDALIYQVAYEPPGVFTHSQLPDTTTEAVLTAGGSAKVTLDAKLQPKIGHGEAGAGVEIEAHAKTKDFDLLRTLVSAVGVGQRWSRWMLNSEGLIQDDVRFIAVLRVKQGIEMADIDVAVRFIDERFILADTINEKSGTYRCNFDETRCLLQ